MPRKRQTQKGANIFHDIYDNVVKPVYHKVLRPAHDFVKANKVISKVAKLIPHPKAQIIGEAADKLGYGKRGGAKRRMAGGARKRPVRRAILV